MIASKTVTFFLLIAFIAINTLYADHLFYFKGGGGLGYDSNVLSSVYPYQSAYFSLSAAGQYEYDFDTFSVFASANADSDIYDVFFYLNAGVSVGSTFSLNTGNLFRLQGNYYCLMDIKQLFGALLEFSQDIADFSTVKAGYEFNYSVGAATVTDEQYISHSARMGLNVDMGSAGYADLSIRDIYSVYPLVPVAGSELKHNGISAGLTLTFLPDAVFEIALGGRYAYHDSFTTNLTVFSGTNGISLYNSSSVFGAGVDVKINWTSSFITGLSFQYDWTALQYYPITESVYFAKISLEYYLSESLKLEFPLTYDLKSSSLSGNIDRWKIEGNIYYMF